MGEVQEALKTLNPDCVLSYSDFLAAMVPSSVNPGDHVVVDAFRCFDADLVAGSGRNSHFALQDFAELIHSTADKRKEVPTVAPPLTSSPQLLKKKQQVSNRLKTWWLK